MEQHTHGTSAKGSIVTSQGHRVHLNHHEPGGYLTRLASRISINLVRKDWVISIKKQPLDPSLGP